MGLFDKPTPAQAAVARIQGELNATVAQVTRSLANIRTQAAVAGAAAVLGDDATQLTSLYNSVATILSGLNGGQAIPPLVIGS